MTCTLDAQHSECQYTDHQHKRPTKNFALGEATSLRLEFLKSSRDIITCWVSLGHISFEGLLGRETFAELRRRDFRSMSRRCALAIDQHTRARGLTEHDARGRGKECEKMNELEARSTTREWHNACHCRERIVCHNDVDLTEHDAVYIERMPQSNIFKTVSRKRCM